MKRTITGRSANRRMSLGDLRQFVASIGDLPDAATVKARVTFGKYLRTVTVEEDDVGYRDYARSMKAEDDDDTSGESTG